MKHVTETNVAHGSLHRTSMSRCLSVIAVLATVICTVAQAQQAQDNIILTPYRDISVALYGSYNFNQHSAGMQGLPTIPSCCPEYGNGTGNGFILGLMTDVYLSDQFSFQGRVGIHSGGGLLRALETETVNTSGTEQVGVFEHTITSQHLWLAVEPLLAFSPIENFQILAGPSVGILMKATFAQKETILEPSDAVFENDSTSRAIYSGTIPETNTLAFGVTAGLRYAIPIAEKSWYIAPEVFYTLSATDLQKDQAWKMNALRFGLSVQYSFWIFPKP